MSTPAKVLSGLLALGLAACSTTGRRNGERAPDWSETPPPAPATPASAPVASAPVLSAPVSPAPVVPAPVSPEPGSAVTVSAPRTAPRPPVPAATYHPFQTGENWVPLRRWCQQEGLVSPALLSAAPAPSYALRSGNGVLVVHAGSRLARWDGLELQLGFAPQLINGQPFVQTLDLQKTIQPLLEGGSDLGLAGNPVIVIDPGHGGENPGTKSVLGNHYEKEFTLDWALRLQSLLAQCGWHAFLTRSNDSDLALSNRVAFATAHRADLFLSLHFNSAAPSRFESGLETYCLTPAGMPSNLTRGFADEVATAFPNNAYDAQNLRLALRVHRALLQVNGNNDRGVRRARFPGVLRSQQCPAVLVEGGYLSNPDEARRINEPRYRQRLAEALAEALTGDRSLASRERNDTAAPAHPEAKLKGQRAQAQPVGVQDSVSNSEEMSHTAEIP